MKTYTQILRNCNSSAKPTWKSIRAPLLCIYHADLPCRSEFPFRTTRGSSSLSGSTTRCCTFPAPG